MLQLLNAIREDKHGIKLGPNGTKAVSLACAELKAKMEKRKKAMRFTVIANFIALFSFSFRLFVAQKSSVFVVAHYGVAGAHSLGEMERERERKNAAENMA